MTRISINDSLRYHAAIAWQFKKYVLAIAILSPFVLVVERYISPLVIAWLINGIQHKTLTLDSAWPAIGLYLAIQIMTQVIGYRIILWLMWKLQIKGSTVIFTTAYDNLLGKSLRFYADNFMGSLVSKINRLSGAYLNFINSATYQVGFGLTSIVATLVGIGFIFWQYSLVLGVLIIVFAFLAFWGTRILGPKYKERSEAYNEISAQLSDSFANITLIKSDGGTLREEKSLAKAIHALNIRERDVRNHFVTITGTYSAVVAMIRVGVIISAVWAAQHINLDVAKIYLILTFTFNLIEEIWNINSVLRDYYQIVGDTEDTLDILGEEPDIQDKSNKKLIVKNGAISLKDISFTHDARGDQPFFHDFNLSVKPGQRVGLVGHSGSGKTTLTKLLLRFSEVNQGSINIDKQDISEVTQGSLRDSIAYVPQEPLLFHRSLKENIAYGKPDATIAQIKAAAKKAHALDFIEQLPDGFDTLVGERGVKLSGGQRQRIAIARAILKDAPILILDEATSALDSESEKLIQDALTDLMKDRTSVVIAHRLSTIAKLDRIVVLEEGKIIEDGTHAELLKKKGTYAKLWSHQSGGFIEE